MAVGPSRVNAISQIELSSRMSPVRDRNNPSHLYSKVSDIALDCISLGWNFPGLDSVNRLIGSKLFLTSC